MASRNTPTRRGRRIQRQKGGTVEGSFRPVDTLRERDRRTEIARRYYPSGQLEAERLRIRETEKRDRLTLPTDRRRGFFGRVWETVAGGVVFFLVGIVGAFVFDAWWGPFASLLVFSIYVVLWDL